MIDSYREDYDAGPLGPTDPRTLLLSMSDYKQPQNYEVYGKCCLSLVGALPPESPRFPPNVVSAWSGHVRGELGS